MQKTARAVLVVEDDEPTCALLSAIVTRNGFVPVEARDGKVALTLLDAAFFDAVLLDLLLPEISGVEILAHLHARTPDVLKRVVVVTAALEPEWLTRMEVQRARCVIRKPFNVEDLEREMLACCEAKIPR